ncbi:MAG: hypothetical protein ABL886_04590 [Rhodoglobus sp.]
MEAYKVVLSPSAKWTRAVVSHGPDELLRAILPPSSLVRHEQSARVFLEGLALWFDARLHVVLSVDAQDAGCCLGLTDELGLGRCSIYYEVSVIERGGRRRRGSRLRGVGDFADLRQLQLVPNGGER